MPDHAETREQSIRFAERRRQFGVEALANPYERIVLLGEVVANRLRAFIEPQISCFRRRERQELRNERLIIRDRQIGVCVDPWRPARPQHDRRQPLDQPVIRRRMRLLADQVRLNAAEHRQRKVGNIERSAADPVDGVRPAIVGLQHEAAL